MRPKYWGRIAMRPHYPGHIANSGSRKTHNSPKPSDRIFLRLHRDAARDLAPHRESSELDGSSRSAFDSRCGASSRAASLCSLGKILSEGFWELCVFRPPEFAMTDVAWVVGPHRDASWGYSSTGDASRRRVSMVHRFFFISVSRVVKFHHELAPGEKILTCTPRTYPDTSTLLVYIA